MLSRAQFTAPVRLFALFVVVSGVPLVALGWLGVRLLDQDRALESQRQREVLDNAASVLVRDLDRGLSTWEELLLSAARGDPIDLPSGGVFLLMSGDGVEQQLGAPLAYYPELPPAADTVSATFAAAEALEFRDQDLAGAVAVYRRQTTSPDRSTRAQAWMRLARCLRKQQRVQEALAAYEALSRLETENVAGSPAPLVARRERVVLLDEIGDAQVAARERELIHSALIEGRFRIDRPTFEFFREFASVQDARSAVADDPLHLAQSIEAIWPTWHEQPAGRGAWTGDAGTFAAVWRRTPRGTASITARIDGLIASARAEMERLQVRVALDDRAGRRAWGTLPNGPRVTKTPADTGVPWTLHVASADPGAARALVDFRRNLFVGGFALMALVIAAASYFVFRAVNRELGVARLQSDFVAAVSHEFRTPLTAMCHLTEMLEEGSARPDRLPDYYRALGKESRRLHSMVEGLLDFGRMDSGRRSYEFSETDASDLVRLVVQEFTERVPEAAPRIEVANQPGDAARLPIVRADREALALAVRNLLDNALKYSPSSAKVLVSVEAASGSVTIAVEDHGPGIPAQEQREIFRKFARGAAARALNVKGTGIGLAMVDQIVKAHAGRLALVSEPGRGSRFTIELRAQQA